MGVAYPYLALISVAVFIVAVSSATLLYIHVVDQVNRTPLLSVYAESHVDESTGEVDIIVTVKHERGNPVELEQIKLFSDTGLVVVDGADSVGGPLRKLEGCEGALIPPGGLCRVKLRFPRGYFSENVTYKGLVVLSEGTYPIAFTPMKPMTLEVLQVCPITGMGFSVPEGAVPVSVRFKYDRYMNIQEVDVDLSFVEPLNTTNAVIKLTFYLDNGTIRVVSVCGRNVISQGGTEMATVTIKVDPPVSSLHVTWVKVEVTPVSRC